MQDAHFAFFDTVQNYKGTYWEAAHAGSKIFVAATSDGGIPAQEPKAVSKRVDEAIGNIKAAAFFDDVRPDIVQVSFGFRRNKVRH